MANNIGNSIYDFFFGRNIGKNTGAQPSVVMLGGSSYRTKSGETVSPELALRDATVMSCINTIGQAIAQLPVETNRTVFDKPNYYQTRYEFLYSVIHSLLAYGNSYTRLIRAANGKVIQMIPLDPAQMRVQANAAGVPQYFIEDQDIAISYKDIVHVKDVNTFNVGGLSRVQLCSERIGTLMASDSLMADIFGNGIDIGTLVTTEVAVDPKIQDEFNNRLQNFKTGGSNRGGSLFINNAKVEMLKGITPADADLRALREMLIREIAAIFKVPEYMVGGTANAKYSNVRQSQTGFYRDTLVPLIISIEQAFTLKLGTEVKFDVADFQKGDMASQTEVSTKLVASGIWTPNEARAYVGYEPMDGGDTLTTTELPQQDDTGTVDEPNATNANPQEDPDGQE